MERGIFKFVAHSKTVINVAMQYGWLPAARYTNLRDVRSFERLGFLDILWKDYNFGRHLLAAKSTRPLFTVAQDICNEKDIFRILDEANELGQYADYVVIVPKVLEAMPLISEYLGRKIILGYSVPSRYGFTPISPREFKGRVHLLGGRPDIQRVLGDVLNVTSLDCNRFTLDAAYGDYFDGRGFRPHPKGGYLNCVIDSLRNINRLWHGYRIKGGNENE